MKMDLLTSLYVFMLAAFIGFEVIRRDLAAPAHAADVADQCPRRHRRRRRHHPRRRTRSTHLPPSSARIAIVAATSNIVGGFLITDRMLKMFKSSGPKK